MRNNRQIRFEHMFKLEGMTFAVTNMKSMLEFYSAVFGIRFEKSAKFGSTLYSGQFMGLNVVFCPAEIAGNTAKQNRHQFDIIVTDLKKIVKNAIKNGGETIGEIEEDETKYTMGIYDPDRNSMVLKQYKY